jgi:cytoskeleton protein RodZ
MDEAFATILEQLRAARLARAWELADVAKQLHITATQVAAIEEGRFQDLPGSAFARGYLRNYARLLGLDTEQVLAAYDRQAGGSGALPAQQVLPHSEVPLLDYSRRTVIFSVLLALALIALGWWLWGSSEGSSNTSVSTSADVSAASRSNSQVALSTPASPAAAPLESAVLSSPTASAASPTAVAATTSATRSAGLHFQFFGNCWLQVRDSSGRILISTLAKAGQELSVTQGQPPYSILLGKASAVQIQYQGKPVVLPANALNVARLQVGVAVPSAATAGAQSSAVAALAESSSGAAQSAHAHLRVGNTGSVVVPAADATTTHEVAHATSVTHSTA